MSNKNKKFSTRTSQSKYVGMFKPNQKIGNWTVLSEDVFFDDKSRAYISCQCNCGSKQLVSAHHLNKNKSTKCEGCNRSWVGRGYDRNSNWKGEGAIPKTLFSSTKRSAINNNMSFDITPEYANAIYAQSSGCCSLTGQPISTVNNTARLVPMSGTSGFVEGNVMWVHSSVAPILKNKPPNEFIEMCLNVANNHQFKGNK